MIRFYKAESKLRLTAGFGDIPGLVGLLFELIAGFAVVDTASMDGGSIATNGDAARLALVTHRAVIAAEP